MTRNTNKHHRISKLIFSALLLSALTQVFPGPAHADSEQLRAEMKQMNWNLRRAVKAESPEQLTNYLEQIQQHAENAIKEGFHQNSEVFTQGMDKVISTVETIQTSVNSGDMEQAKSELKELNRLKKEYHDKLDV